MDDFDAFCEAVYGPEQQDIAGQQQQHLLLKEQGSGPAGQEGVAMDRTSSGNRYTSLYAGCYMTMYSYRTKSVQILHGARDELGWGGGGGWGATSCFGQAVCRLGKLLL